MTVSSLISFEEACQWIKKASNFDDIVSVFDAVFRASKEKVEAYSELESVIKNFPENPTNIQLYDLLNIWGRTDWEVTHSMELSSEIEKNIERARSITGTAVKVEIENMGKEFIGKYIPNIQSNIEKIEHLTKAIFENSEKTTRIYAERNSWIHTKFEKMLKSNKDYLELVREREQIQNESVNPYADSRYGINDKKIRNVRNTIHNHVVVLSNEQFPQLKALGEERRTLDEQKNTALKEMYEAVISALNESSQISMEEAIAWVENNIFIAENAKKKLNRIGYKADRLKLDLAELYRYLGGKLGPIEFVLEGNSRRAFARGRCSIAIQGAFNKRTLFHECGHLAEAWDPVFQASCMAFIKDRATGSPVSLKKLTGAGYRSDERAYPDSFIDPYVGKDYSGRASEVFSMSLQQLESPEALAALAQKDQEHLTLLMGFCQRQNPQIKKQAEAITEKARKRAEIVDRQKLWEKALDKVATPEFGKRLEGHETFHGLRFSGGRTGYLMRDGGQDSYGGHEWIYVNVSKEPKVVLRRLAYLLIANELGLLPEKYGTDADNELAKFVIGNEIPDWYTPDLNLPRVL